MKPHASLKLGIVGLGVISDYYLTALQEVDGFTLDAVCDHDERKLTRFQPDGIASFTDYRDILTSDCDCVVVNLPNDLHESVCVAALAAGKHVCCEKPLALKAAGSQFIIAIAERQKRVLLTAFHRRYNRNVIAAKRAIAAFGSPSLIRATYKERIEDHCGQDNWYLEPARCGGGCIADNGPNVLDTLIDLFGQVTVTDAKTVRNESGIDVQATINLQNEAGVPIVVDLDWQYSHGEHKRIEVLWSNGEALSVDMLGGFDHFKSSLAHEYVGVLEHFRDVVRGARGPEARGLDVSRLIDRAYLLDAAQERAAA